MSTASDIIASVRTQIPDPTSAFDTAQLLAWINDAGRFIAIDAPIIKDWRPVQSISGQDVYGVESYITDILKGWYDLKPLRMSSEADNIFITKIGGPSWFIGPHSQTGTANYWQVWPAPNRTGAVTTLTADVTDTANILPITDSSGMMAFGFVQIDDEIIRYANLPTPGSPGNMFNLVRGQGGTIPAAHSNGATVTELNIMLQVSRLPRPLLTVDDPVDIPQALWPIIELYVISKVRETEQNHEIAASYMSSFLQVVERMANKAQLNKPRQGLQVRPIPFGLRGLYNGRLYIP